MYPRNVRIDSSAPRWFQRANINIPAQGDPANPMNAIAGQVHSAAALLASGQRVTGALKSFAPAGTTPRSLGRTPSRPELLDAPHYKLVIELHFPEPGPDRSSNPPTGTPRPGALPRHWTPTALGGGHGQPPIVRRGLGRHRPTDQLRQPGTPAQQCRISDSARGRHSRIAAGKSPTHWWPQ